LPKRNPCKGGKSHAGDGWNGTHGNGPYNWWRKRVVQSPSWEQTPEVGGPPLWPFGVADPLWLWNVAPDPLRVEIRGFFLPIPGPRKGPAEMVVVKEKEVRICTTDMDLDTEEVAAWVMAAAWASDLEERPRAGPMWEEEEEAFPVAGPIRGTARREPLMLPEWPLQPPGHGPWDRLLMEPPIIPGRRKFAC
jgi:hypothetical protein